RYASLPNIMKAKKKPIEEKIPDAYGVDVKPRLQVLKTAEPSGRKSGVKVASAAELGSKLKDEAGGLWHGHASCCRGRLQNAQGCHDQGADRGERVGRRWCRRADSRQRLQRRGRCCRQTRQREKSIGG